MDGSKVKDGSLGGGEFQAPGPPYTRIAQELRTSVNVQVPGGAEPFVVVPVPALSYTQEAGRTDSYVGAVDVTFQAGCTAPRAAVSYLLMDPPPFTQIEPAGPDDRALRRSPAGASRRHGSARQATRR